MSITRPPRRPEEGSPGADEDPSGQDARAEPPRERLAASNEDVCAFCGARLGSDQEWCLECGSARTLIHRAPDWRVPVMIVAAVILLCLTGLAVALIDLSAQANRSPQPARVLTQPAPHPAPRPQPPQPAPARAPSPPRRAASIADWPSGLSGWTVVLGQWLDPSPARSSARRLIGRGIKVGVLYSSRHPSMPPGFWIVFSGRYPDEAAAARAAAALRDHGHPLARARLVARPGGI